VGEAGGDGGAAAVDASPDGADGVVHRDPPCPLSSFPYGTYHLKTNAAEEYLDSLGGSCSAELGRRSMTVSIAPSSTFPGCDQVTIDTEAGRFMFPTRFDCALFEESQAGVHFWDSVCRTGEPPQCFYRDEFSIEIDRSTGVVTSFSYDVVKSPDPSRERHDRGTGWPVCAATEASPPSWVPEPPVPTAGSLCYGTGVPMPVLALGCRFENVWGFPGPPTCESAFNLCKAVPGATCQNTSEGYAAHCCVP
jgi:hypothetical protein